MKKEEILQALKDNNYKIEMESDCGCNIDWKITNEELQPEISCDSCWVGNILYINDQAIAEQLAYEEFNVIIDGLSTEEFRIMLEENNLEHIIEEMQFDENNTENESHNNKLTESLVDFINENKYLCYIRYPRNFSNEYDCILVDKNANIGDSLDNAEEITSEKFANNFLEKGDASTQYYIGFDYID